MFGKRFKLFSLLGLDVHVDVSWAILALLVTWTLAVGYFPNAVEGLGSTMYWLMGAVGALGLFISIILHELSHSLVARRHGIRMKGITLFIFGGVAEMQEEPRSPKSEFLTAIVGPLSSVLIAAVFWGGAMAWPGASGTAPAQAVLGYLAFINLMLALFNLVPAFPLDGGRALRALLWSRHGSLRRATRLTAGIGSGVGIVLILFGVLRFIAGNVVGGVWMAMIGLFLRNAASMSYQQLLVRRILEDEPVERFMKTDVIRVRESVSVNELIDDYFYRHHHRMFPVVNGNDKLLGYVTVQDVREVPREERGMTIAREVMTPYNDGETIAPGEPVTVALARMGKSDMRRLLVVQEGGLEGIVASRDIVEFLALKMELDEPDAKVQRLEESALQRR